jgi:hypothetical protein
MSRAKPFYAHQAPEWRHLEQALEEARALKLGNPVRLDAAWNLITRAWRGMGGWQDTFELYADGSLLIQGSAKEPYRVNDLLCTCPDNFHRRAVAGERCKHRLARMIILRALYLDRVQARVDDEARFYAKLLGLDYQNGQVIPARWDVGLAAQSAVAAAPVEFANEMSGWDEFAQARAERGVVTFGDFDVDF